MQAGGLVGEDVDAFVQVAVAGGLGDARVAGQAVHAAALAEPAQYQHRLPERPERARALRCADPPPVGGQQPGEELDGVAWDVERLKPAACSALTAVLSKSPRHSYVIVMARA